MQHEVLEFWFREVDPKSWWSASPAFDRLVTERFRGLLEQAARGECFAWRADAQGRLAEILVLDQFSRHVHRGGAAAFAQDPMALALAQEAVARGCHLELEPTRRVFLLLPYMHSESPRIHELAEALYRAHAPEENLRFELRHKAIIDRFGRYPHRNAALGRASTPEEVEFLRQPGSSF
ncbi:MAG: DUF924 family protein [Betaproteobacteria bacterium]|nr:DUF924 family protein [Betaproteobacteria bacterium]